MIVEDEPPIAKALGKLITKCSDAFEVAGIAFNGAEAIEKYGQWKPDVIFTDIRMPIMDGFRFLEYLKEKNQNPVTFILSGHEDFNYARQAIRYHVKGYLLKPISKKELQKSLDEAEQEITACERIKKDGLVKLSLSEWEQQIETGDCYVGTCCFGPYPMSPDDGMLPGISDMAAIDLEGYLTRICPDICCWVFNADSSVEKIIIIEGIQEKEKDEIFERMFFYMTENSNSPVTMATYRTGVSLSSIGSIYKQLRVELYQRLVLGKSQMCICGADKRKEEPPDWSIDLQDLRTGIVNTDMEEANQRLKRFLEDCEKKAVSQKKTARYLNIIMGYYYERYPMMQTKELEIENIISNARNYQELYEEIIHFLNMLCRAETAMPVVHPLAKKLKDYLDTNYQKVITNSTLAEEFGFVATYLSRVFKNQYGMTPSVYLVQIRMEHAKKMMREQPDCLVKEVAEAVGYSDQYYFSKVFHKETSVWPTEFRA